MEERRNTPVPPNSVDAERSVLGGMLIDSGALELALEQLYPEDFYVPAHQTIFAAIRDLHNEGSAVDLITLNEMLDRHGKSDLVGGAAYLAELISFVPTAVNTQEYIKIVEEKSVRRLLIHAGGEIITDGMNEEESLEKTLDASERKIFEISMRKSADSMQSIGEVVPLAYNEISDLMERKGVITGINTGFTELNRITNGFQKSDLIIVAARPAMGKTAFALNIAQYAALHDNRTVCIFSLEMSAQQLVQRMLCTEASVSSQKIKEGTVTSDELARLIDVMDPISNAKIYIDDTGGIGIAEIRSKCRRLRARRGLDMVIIDYLQLLQAQGNRRSDSRTQEISDMTRQLKLLARELDIPVVLLAQLNRGPETRQDHTPLIADLRESGSIEQDADMVILLYRPAVYDEDADDVSRVIIAKHRHGPIGTVNLVWQGDYTRFMNLAPEYQE